MTSDGKVGIGTTSPISNVQVNSDIGAGTTLSLVNLSEGGDFWTMMSTGIDNDEVAGSLLLFNHRGPRVPFIIVPDGRVGLGTIVPDAQLHVSSDFGDGTTLRLQNESDGGDSWTMMSTGEANSEAAGSLLLFNRNGTSVPFMLDPDGRLGLGTTAPSFPLEMESGAHVTEGGVWTDASSRLLKENIQDLSAAQAMDVLTRLDPKSYNYKSEKDEQYLGFIAEDVPELVAMGNRKSLSPMDFVAILTKVVQEQQRKILELEALINQGN